MHAKQDLRTRTKFGLGSATGPSWHHRVAVGSLLVAAGVGCGDSGRSHEELAARHLAIPTVHLQDIGGRGTETVSTEVVYSSLRDSPTLELSRVVDALLFPDGRLLIADQGTSALIWVNLTGEILSRSGGVGEGPGEYTRIQKVGLGQDGNAFVFDGRQQRITVLDAVSQVSSVERVDLGRYLPYDPLVRLSDGSFISALETRPVVGPGVHREPLYFVSSNAGKPQQVDTLGSWSGKQFFMTQDGSEKLPVPFARTTLYNARGNYSVVGETDSIDITLFSDQEPIFRIVHAPSPRPVSESEGLEWMQRMVAPLPEQLRPIRQARLQESPSEKTLPAFGGLAVDLEGRIWIGEYAAFRDSERRWTVIDRDGRYAAQVHLPIYRPDWLEVENTIPGYAVHELLDVTDTHVVLLRKDDLDVHHIEVRAFVIP